MESGAAVMFAQQDLTPQMLAEEILRIINDQTRLETMSESMKKLGISDAAERIVGICLDLSRK